MTSIIHHTLPVGHAGITEINIRGSLPADSVVRQNLRDYIEKWPGWGVKDLTKFEKRYRSEVDRENKDLRTTVAGLEYEVRCLTDSLRNTRNRYRRLRGRKMREADIGRHQPDAAPIAVYDWTPRESWLETMKWCEEA